MKLSDSKLFSRIIALTPYSEFELATLILTASSRYKTHYIEKRNNRGKREISQPTAEVKFLQRLVVDNELSELKIHPCAFAYRKNKSIVDHASLHAKNHFLLKLDFEDFFPSLNEDTLSHRLRLDTNYSPLEIEILKRILLKKERKTQKLTLSIGAPSSPFISNYLMHEFDHYMDIFCSKNELVYSRYADDIAISTSHPKKLDDAKKYAILLLSKMSYLNLTLNHDKTVNVSKKFRRELVGLVLSNEGKVTIGRDDKRILRATMNAFINGKLDEADAKKMMGQLAYYYSVDKAFVCSLLAKYNLSSLRDLTQKIIRK